MEGATYKVKGHYGSTNLEISALLQFISGTQGIDDHLKGADEVHEKFAKVSEAVVVHLHRTLSTRKGEERNYPI